jgi:hypothetical protein
VKKLAIREEPAEHELYEFQTVVKQYTESSSVEVPMDSKVNPPSSLAWNAADEESSCMGSRMRCSRV